METFLKMADSACGKLKRTKRSHVREAEALATEKLFSGRSHEAVSIKELQRNRENFLRIRGKNTSKGRASCKVNFLDKNKKWLHPSRCFNLPLSRDGKETDISQLFTVPKYAYTMSVQLSVINEGAQGEVTYTGALLLEL